MANPVDRFVYTDTIRVGAWCPVHDASHLVVTQVFIVTWLGVWRSQPKRQCA